jgi:hypothetical protein
MPKTSFAEAAPNIPRESAAVKQSRIPAAIQISSFFFEPASFT